MPQSEAKRASHRRTIERRRERLQADPSSKRESDINHNRTRTVYQGQPCSRGHGGERYITGHCVECLRERLKTRMARLRKDPDTRGKINKQQSAASKRWYHKTKTKRPNAKIENQARSALSCLFKIKSPRTALKLLGVSSLDEYKAHLASLFLPGMSWANYGKYAGSWCIDHIIPTNSFDLLDEKQKAAAFNYKNTQPLWFGENARKSCQL